ncbi:MAG: hypothetical protein CFH22_01545 [Alphaproteobacteria bacterium MarineAlpha5_Bin12]|nr:hypothetical protein [Pelagibacteraceae bacterium]PPR40431.1 MAG: hypothetical protein CFH22_01545 [Alphaproteobacteria bacterium MarineAlpha5_Bin12]
MDRNKIKILIKNASSLKDTDWTGIEKLIKKFSNSGNKLHNKKYLKNKLVKSPFGNSYVAIINYGNKKFMGFASLTRKSFLYNNQISSSFEMGDIYLDKKLQGRFIFIKMIKKLMLNLEKKFDKGFVYGTPNNLSLLGFIRCGFSLSNYQLLNNFLPLRLDSLIKTKLLRFLLRYVGIIYILLLKGYLKIFALKNKLNFYQINNTNNLQMNIKTSHNIQSQKTKEYIKWRFFDNPHKYNFFSIKDNNKFVGYIVFSEKNRKYGRALYIVDYFFDQKYENYFINVMSEIILKKYNLNNYYHLSSWISKKSKFYKNLKFILPFTSIKIPFIVYKKLTKKCFLDVDKKNIHFVFGDGDNI